MELKLDKCVGVVGIVGGVRIWNCGLWLVNGDTGRVWMKISGDLWGM